MIAQSIRELDQWVHRLVETVASGKGVYVSGRRVLRIELIPSKYRYKVRLIFEDGSERIMYPSVLASRHIEVI